MSSINDNQCGLKETHVPCRALGRSVWQWALHGLDLSSSIHFWHDAHKRPRLLFLFDSLWNFIASTLTNCSLFLEATLTIGSRFGVLDSTSLVALLLIYLLFASFSVSPTVYARMHWANEPVSDLGTSTNIRSSQLEPLVIENMRVKKLASCLPKPSHLRLIVSRIPRVPICHREDGRNRCGLVAIDHEA